jgi:hypothetical protein
MITTWWPMALWSAEFRNSEVNMSRSRPPCVFLQSRKFRWDWISPRQYGLKLVIPLVIGQHHPPQMKVNVFCEVARFFGVVLAGTVCLPDFNQSVR